MELRRTGEWVFNEQRPEGEGPHRLILLLHGWTGDENSMGIFAAKLPKQNWLVAPRGIYPSPSGGYSWFREQGEKWPWVDDFRTALELLFDLLIVENFPMAEVEKVDLIGFSQGAALAYAMVFLFPLRVRSVAGLAGFLPEGCAALARNQPLKGKRLFVVHGTLDERIPIEMGRYSASVLREAGGEVSYCEAEVGHKISAECFKKLKEFYPSSG